jgi:hypothetical protein
MVCTAAAAPAAAAAVAAAPALAVVAAARLGGWVFPLCFWVLGASAAAWATESRS